MTAAAVSVESVGMEYSSPSGLVCALNGVTFEVEAGSSVAIAGRSGSGKSTLLAVIGGLEVATTGRVTLAGRDLSTMGDTERTDLRRHQIGFVFQSDNLLPFLTAVDNVGLQSSLDGATGGSERCLELLDRVGLAEHAVKLPDQLSRGQRQRVAVARALVHGPGVILADEPTGALDHENADLVVRLLLEAAATLVVVTHDSSVAERMDQRLAISDGRLVEHG